MSTSPNWVKTGSGSILLGQASSSGKARFTDWSMLALDDNQLRGLSGPSPVNLQDCEFHGGNIYSAGPTLNFSNCLLERVETDIQPTDSQLAYLQNNTLFGGKLGYTSG